MKMQPKLHVLVFTYFVLVKSVPTESEPCASSVQTQDEVRDSRQAAMIAVKTNNLSALKRLLDKDGSLLSVRDQRDQSLLHIAAGRGALDIVKYLIDERRMDMNRRARKQYGNTILHIAARNGHLDLVKYFIETRNFLADEQNQVGQTPLFLAAETVQLHVVKYLIEERGVNATAEDNNYDNILFVSSANGDVSVPRYLIDERKVVYDYEWRDYLGDTILHRAAWYGNVEFLKYFVEEKKANLNHVDSFERPPVYQAVFRGQVAAMKFLVEHGADLDMADRLGKKPINATRDSRITGYLSEIMAKRREEAVNVRPKRSLISCHLPPFPRD